MPKHAILVVAYLVALHGVLAFGVLKREALEAYARRWGWLESEQAAHYSQMFAYHRRIDAHVPEGAVLFVGDSHVQSLCVAAIVDRAVNFGIGGDTTEGVLRRLPEYASLKRARAVVLAVGYNDLCQRENTDVAANYARILGIIPQDVKVLVCSVLPTDERCRPERLNQRIGELNRLAENMCDERANCWFFDVGDHLTDDTDNLARQYHEGDGVHLNAAGYQVFNEWLKMRLGGVLAANQEM